VITSIGPVHLELLGTIENVARAKAEVIAALPAGGIAIVPDEPLLEPYLARDDIQIRRFGENNVTSFERIEGGSRVGFDLGGEALQLEFPFTARHQAQNAAAALLAVRALGLPLPQSRVDVELSRWRGEESPLPGGGLLINDAYNANPASMRAALEHLAEHEGRTVAVLGEMAELGPTSPEYHQEIGELVSDLGIDVVLGVGELARAYGGEWVADAAKAAERAPELVQPGDVVLVKGSRAIGLEVVANERIVSTEIYEGLPEGVSEQDAATVNTATFIEIDGRTMVTLLIQATSKVSRDAIIDSGMEAGLQDALDLAEQVAISLR
jgi:UDP-N-acetylmuramoyl-tripeptide--D-alanyl-D-alanine ligase